MDKYQDRPLSYFLLCLTPWALFFAALSYIKILYKSIIIQYSYKLKKYQFYFMLSCTVKNDHCY